MKILVYDRSLEVRYLIQKYITQISGSVEVCSVGNAAMLIPEMKNSDYRVLVLDVDNLRGFFPDLKEIIKKDCEHTIILLTLFPDKKAITKFLNQGANYCFDKIGDIDKFFETLKSIIAENTKFESNQCFRAVAI